MTTETENVLIVFCTCPERITAESLAKQLVEQKLAACVNIINDITSVYVWDDEVKMEPEVQLLIKTTTTRMDALKAFILEVHPYEVPEIIALPVVDGNENYLEWVIKET